MIGAQPPAAIATAAAATAATSPRTTRKRFMYVNYGNYCNRDAQRAGDVPCWFTQQIKSGKFVPVTPGEKRTASPKVTWPSCSSS
jgi:hypothetical protein